MESFHLGRRSGEPVEFRANTLAIAFAPAQTEAKIALPQIAEHERTEAGGPSVNAGCGPSSPPQRECTSQHGRPHDAELELSAIRSAAREAINGDQFVI